MNVEKMYSSQRGKGKTAAAAAGAHMNTAYRIHGKNVRDWRAQGRETNGQSKPHNTHFKGLAAQRIDTVWHNTQNEGNTRYEGNTRSGKR